jgi:hypothetical protein
VHGMSSRVIGELMGVSPATVDTRVARARTMLRETAKERAISTPGAAGATAASFTTNHDDPHQPPSSIPITAARTSGASSGTTSSGTHRHDD